MNIEHIINPKLWDSIESNYKAGKYSNAIVDAMLYLTNILREKADLNEDGYDLVNRAFSKKDLRIQITKLESETDQNKQDGYANILRGLYQMIRNPRHHENINDSQNEAFKIILFVDYIIEILNSSKASFELDDIETIIFDDDQIEDEDYMRLIIDRIPKRKLYEVVIKVYNRRTLEDINPFRRFFSCAFDLLKPDEVLQFINIISQDLIKTKNDNDRKYIIGCIPKSKWNDIDQLAKLRTENRIIKSIEEGKANSERKTIDTISWFATWCTKLFSEFTMREKLLQTILNKLYTKEEFQIRYLFVFILNSIWPLVEIQDIEGLNQNNDELFYVGKTGVVWYIKKQIQEGNKLYFDFVNQNKYYMPDYLREYFKEALVNFKENEENTLLNENDPVDDLPF